MPLGFAQVDDRTAVERLTSEADVLAKSHKDLRWLAIFSFLARDLSVLGSRFFRPWLATKELLW
ncbi:hypothetical protein TIFTF001_041263 [Ficus carica]|uniref:Uncharacterized protein n=1 Tax=Ficus carica TaxID=3494 RepID=A0AA87ZAU8_FICCA|nr:hypothetical protein TIFTF001_041263 [Ficus carica]